MEAWSSAYGHRARVFDIVFDAEGCRFATASEDCTARIWRERASDSPLRGYEQQTCLTGHEAEVLRVGWNHDGSMFATGGLYSTFRMRLKFSQLVVCVCIYDAAGSMPVVSWRGCESASRTADTCHWRR